MEIIKISKVKKSIRRLWENIILKSDNTLLVNKDVYKLIEWPEETKFIVFGISGDILIYQNGNIILSKNISNDLKSIYLSHYKFASNEFLSVNITFAEIIKKSKNDVYLLILVSVTKFSDDSQYPSASMQFLTKVDLDDLSILNFVKCTKKLSSNITFSHKNNLLIAKQNDSRNVSIYNELNFKNIENSLIFFNNQSFIDDEQNLVLSLSNENVISSWDINNLNVKKDILSNLDDGVIQKFTYCHKNKYIAYTTFNSKNISICNQSEVFKISLEFLDVYDEFSFSSEGNLIIIFGSSYIHIFDLLERKSILHFDYQDFGDIITDVVLLKQSKSMIIVTFNSIIREIDLSEYLI
jgi:hypothetical protein